MDEQARKLKWALIRFVIAILVLVTVTVVFVIREGNVAEELREALIENCQTSAVRETLTEILQNEIDESHGPLTAKIGEALHLTPRELEQIVDEQNAVRLKRISQIEPDDCEEQYK